MLKKMLKNIVLVSSIIIIGGVGILSVPLGDEHLPPVERQS
ncbi:hypothetical protein [Alkalibacterium olivapovliticus]|uniref:Uncharacterized protein n=1 Tax=Alkalibacterium olivapovliticus TaxID=99907 RepID=A0A2T0VTA2_9LACT|nr:hypothetical protein [Alkalibacterium olivapovliticus]PRY74218.1 hypothetical protein CLV38_1454 [Alkalibacterium olivapovliticus]